MGEGKKAGSVSYRPVTISSEVCPNSSPLGNVDAATVDSMRREQEEIQLLASFDEHSCIP